MKCKRILRRCRHTTFPTLGESISMLWCRKTFIQHVQNNWTTCTDGWIFFYIVFDPRNEKYSTAHIQIQDQTNRSHKMTVIIQASNSSSERGRDKEWGLCDTPYWACTRKAKGTWHCIGFNCIMTEHPIHIPRRKRTYKKQKQKHKAGRNGFDFKTLSKVVLVLAFVLLLE